MFRNGFKPEDYAPPKVNCLFLEKFHIRGFSFSRGNSLGFYSGWCDVRLPMNIQHETRIKKKKKPL